MTIAGREIRTVGTSDRNLSATVAVWDTVITISLVSLISNNTDLKQAVTSWLETLGMFLLRRDASLGTTAGEILKCQW